MKTSHDYADSLERLAAFLRTKEPFNLSDSDAIATLYLYWPQREHFLGLAKAVHGGKKEYVDDLGDPSISYTVTLETGEYVKAKIPRDRVCKVIKPAQEAVYDCEPWLSQAEESDVDKVSA